MSATFLNGKSNLERFEIVVKDLQEIQKTSPPEVADTAVQSSIDPSLVGESSPPLQAETPSYTALFDYDKFFEEIKKNQTEQKSATSDEE